METLWTDGNGFFYLGDMRLGDRPVIESDIVPNPSKVVSCSAWQIRKALNALNLRAIVEDNVEASDNQELKDGWKHASIFFNNDPFVIQMGLSIGKTNEEVTNIIEYANTL